MTVQHDAHQEIAKSEVLTAQAREKAKRLDDGTPIGSLKAKVILALDRLRVINGTLSQYRGLMQSIGTGAESLQPQLDAIQADRDTVDAELDDLLEQLDKLGVKVNIVRRDGYR